MVEPRLERSVRAPPLHQWLATDGTRLVQALRALVDLAVRADVGGVLAFGVARAGDERPQASGPLHEIALGTRRALLACRLGLGLRRIALDVFAVGIAGAADELSVAAHALLQRLATSRAHLVQQLGLGHLAVRRRRPAELALRIPRPAQERTEPAGLHD